MATPLQMWFGGIALHEFGIVSILKQQSAFTPDDLPQKETRQITVRLDVWAQELGYNYDFLYGGIQSIRRAINAQNGVLKWQSPGDPDGGTVWMERPANVVSSTLPDGNAHGVFNQQIEITFKFDLDALGDTSVLTATISAPGSATTPIRLGRVFGWKDGYQTQFYSEFRKMRRISTGVVECSGEIIRFLGETGSSTDNRLAQVLSDLENIKAQLTPGAYIQLDYAKGDSSFFSKQVRIESFHADLGQKPNVGVISWQMTCSYVMFPSEDGYAASDFTTALNKDNSAGRDFLTLNGRVLASTEILAMAKLNLLESLMRNAYGFAATNCTRREITKSWLNTDDTQGETDGTNDGASVPNTNFLELSFSIAWERKQSNVIAYALTVSDSDDLKSGLITRTYSGWVVAGGSNEEAAYQAALAQARTLGDKKLPFRISANEARSDRKLTSQTTAEQMRVEFSYQYATKGNRLYIELSMQSTAETFGESTDQVRGFVVAKDIATAQAAYQSIVKSQYNNRIIRSETTDQHSMTVGLGQPWFDANGTTTLPLRFDFSFNLFHAKTTGTWGCRYASQVGKDYLNLVQQSRLQGTFTGDPSMIAAIQAGDDNPLDTLLDGLSASLGSITKRETTVAKETNGGITDATSVQFSADYVKRIDGTSAVIETNLSEQTTYSARRWVEMEVPSGPSVIQNCGLTAARRVISGSVTAPTEAIAMTWVRAQRASGGLLATWPNGVATPSQVFEEAPEIQTAYKSIPFTYLVARGSGANFTVCEVRFQFRQLSPNVPAPF